MAVLLSGTTIGGQSAIHAGNMADHGIITTSNIGSYALTGLPSHNHDDRYYTESESDSRFFFAQSSQLANTNLNDLTTRGVYYSADQYGTNTNIPFANYFTMINLTNDVGRQAQLWFGDTPGTAYWRPRQGDSIWHPWEKLITSNNIGSQSVNYAASAGSVAWGNVSGRPTALSSFTNDLGNYGGWLTTGGKAADSELLDGINSSSFVRNDATGQYLRAYYQYGSYLTTERPIDLRNQMGGSGMRVDFMNGAGGGNWNHVITFSGYDAYNMYQLGGYYDGGSSTNLYVRSEANHGTTSWTAWRRLLNEVADPYAVNMNQYVRTTDGPTFAQVYASGWFRNYGAQGMYNESYGTHFYSNGGQTWAITGSGASIELQFRSNHQSTIRGYVYANTGNEIGFLSEDGNWVLRTWNRGVEAYGSMRAPIFYDSQDTNYYLDPNSTGTALRISGGIVSTAGNGAVLLKHENSEANAWIFRENAANWGLFWLNAGNQSGQSIGSYTTVGAELFGMNNAVTGFNPSSAWSGTDDSTRAAWMLSNHSGYLWTQGTQYSETDMRAPIFYDSNDTGYYLDPNGTSNLLQLTTATRARWNMPRIWHDRSSRTSDQGYWTGTNGWGTGDGNWDQAWKGGFSGWDIWGEGSAHPQGGQYVHAQGIVSGQHYAASDGSSAYGWMMVGAHAATENRYWLRGKWGGGISGWVEMITTGNIGSQSVASATSASYADSIYWSGSQRLYGGSDGTRNTGWAYHNNNDTGLHWPNNGWHFYPKDVNDMYMRSGSSTNVAIAMNTAGTNRGYVYAENDNTIGFLNNSRSWALRVYSDANIVTYGHYLTVGQSKAWSSILMHDSDEGTREIHCNSNRIGFLTEAGAWGSWCDDNGGWNSVGNISGNYLYSNSGIRVGEIWGLGGLYRNEGSMLFGVEGGAGWSFRDGNSEKVWIGNDGNIYMAWAGAYISTLLDAKQNASTAINTGNIASQSVSYASSAGYVPGGVKYNEWYGNVYIGSGGDFYSTIFYDTNDSYWRIDPSDYSRYNSADINRIHNYGWYTNSQWGDSAMLCIGGDFDPSYPIQIETERWGASLYTNKGSLWALDFVGSSDIRYKTNIADIANGLNVVNSLQPVTYSRFDDPTERTKAGLIAQEVQDVLPHIVSSTIEPETLDEVLGVDYIQLVPYLISAIKQQQQQIEELTNRISQLEQ